jgi:ubiquinone/menaquinone biosynthesis C-methylase UbiE
MADGAVGGRQDDPEFVRSEYADEGGLSGRIAIWAGRPGRQPWEVALDEVVALAPKRVIEVGCGRGEFAEALVKAGIEVVAVDQSARMVELTAARGVDARLGDVQELPFPDANFDVAVANYMLYHVPDLDRGLSELARVLPRPGGVLVAATNGIYQLEELWELVGRDLSDRADLFMRETGEPMLRRHVSEVRRIDLDDTIEVTASEIRDYVAHSFSHKHLAPRVPDFAGTLAVSTRGCVFVATN